MVEWNREKMPEEFWVLCDVCGTRGDPLDIEVRHRSCRLKEAFPDAYAEKDGMLFFDPLKMRAVSDEHYT
jgi:hypothetical protein